ncbi:hypothetical protein M0R89_04225 [Halorussus limi]|uniref:Uncharacterized protein n=1 Tax=Halorussus limi TaxID=2938695 RepID=A0A8U0HWH7_9EURY|nr:hypothetical protein [Halorussus limi]UPV75278.1 hypothetical protein M0R89_04225 [Halorussus limi]
MPGPSESDLTSTKRVTLLVQRAERSKPNETAPNDQITSVINQFGAVINQLDALGGSRITVKTSGVLEHDTGEVITTLDYARNADV